MPESSVSSEWDGSSTEETFSPRSFSDLGDAEELGSVSTPHSGYKKVLVTGGAGFIGSHVAEALLARGDDVVIVDEINDYYNVKLKRSNLSGLVRRYGTNRCKIYEGDICNVDFITKVFEDERPQWICHLAARAGVRPSIQDPFIYIHSNIEGTTRLLELSRRFNVANFSFASSSSVYGEASREVFREDDVVDFPVSPYAMSKKACELIAYTFHHLYGLNISGLRFFTVYGPRGRPDMAPYKFINQIYKGQEIQQFGDGSSARDYTYIEDIVQGVVRSLDRPLGYQIYNLGRGTPTKLSRFIQIVEENLHKKAIIRVLPNQPGDVPRTCADISKATRMLGYIPTISFEEGIRRTVDWYIRDKKTEELSMQQEREARRSRSYTTASHHIYKQLSQEEERLRAYTMSPAIAQL